MKVSPPPPHAARSALARRNRSCEIDVCLEILRTVDSSRAENDDDPRLQRASLRSSSFNDRIGFSGYGDAEGFYAERLEFCRSQRVQEITDEGEDDDADMQWANARGPLHTTIPRFGYGNSKRFCASGQERKVRPARKLASSPSSIAGRQHAGPIKPNSSPFSGPLGVTAKPNSFGKAHTTPSIIPVNFLCKRMIGFDVCDPMSPEVTCLGRIRIKESTVRAATDDKPAAGLTPTPKVEKVRCFDTKNQLCGRRAKGRKKKKIADKSRCLSRRKRFATKESAHSQSFSSSVPSELGETRREKAASLAVSVSNLLEEMRRLDKGKPDFVPSVPPPNSLLLMRRGRLSNETWSPVMRTMDEATRKDCNEHDSAKEEGGAGEASAKNLRNGVPLHVSLLDLIDMEDEACPTSETEDTVTSQRTHAEAQGTALSERENFGGVKKDDDKNNESVVKGWSSSSTTTTPGAALWQRRAIAELTPIEIKPRAKQRAKHRKIR